MDNYSATTPTRRSASPSQLAETFAMLEQLKYADEADHGNKQPANLLHIHGATRAVGRRSQTAPRGSTSPLQEWNDKRRQPVQGNDTPLLQSSLPASQAATSGAAPVAIISSPPAPLKNDPPKDDSIIDDNDPESSGDDMDPHGAGGDIGAEQSYSESIVSSTSDEEYGNLRHPRMAPETRADLERIIFQDKDLTTLRYKKLWEDAKKAEDQYVKEHRAWKYAHDFAAGGINQLTSFGVAGALAVMTGNPWLFPVVAAILSDTVGDRLAQLIRRSTIIPTASKEHFENQRRIARLFGDMIVSCCGKEPEGHFKVKAMGPDGKEIEVRKTAYDMLKASGTAQGLGAFAQNLVVRGLPFLWFAYVYWPRDYYINDYCRPVFFPNATSPQPDGFGVTNLTSPDFCPDPQQVDVTAVRWALQLFGGMMAGGMTMLSNQLVSSCLHGEERTTYSTGTWKLQAEYLKSARQDTKNFLDRIQSGQLDAEFKERGMSVDGIQHLVKSAQVLDRLQAKELSFAEKKSSLWTTYRGELDLATQKHRDETMISPEFAGKRLDTALSMFGKLLSLLTYTYMVTKFSSRQGADHDEKLAQIILLPMYLIVLGGYVWRDDFRLVGHVPYGLFKGCLRAAKGKYAADPELSDVVVDNPARDVYDGGNAAGSHRSSDTEAAQARRDDRNDYDDDDGEAADSSGENNTQPPRTPLTKLAIGGFRGGHADSDSDGDGDSASQ